MSHLRPLLADKRSENDNTTDQMGMNIQRMRLRIIIQTMAPTNITAKHYVDVHLLLRGKGNSQHKLT